MSVKQEEELSAVPVKLKLNTQYKIKYEEYCEFKGSLFRDVYSRMSDTVLEIIEKNEEIQKEKQSSDNEIVYREGEQICNIIALLGKRGSGKSSVLSSYCGFLKDISKLQQDGRIREGCERLLDKSYSERVAFTVLDGIDATLFESEENLLVIILSKMLDKLEHRKENHHVERRDSNEHIQDLRKLRNDIGRIYEYVVSGDKGRKMDEDDPPIVRLQALSNSWNLRKAFKELVEKYIDYMNTYYNAARLKENYIVVPIDDVDMNVAGCIGILEQIRKFLMVPNVIILLAVNYGQLKLICERFFYDQLGIYKKHAEEHERQQVQNLAKEYLEKMLPTGRKILMPDLYSNDGIGKREIEIEGVKLDGISEMKMTPENYIAYVLRLYTGMICDLGENRAYLLKPRSLRKLNNYVREFQQLRLPVNENGYLPKNYERNMKWLYRDITHRYIEQSEAGINTDLIEGFCRVERMDQFSYLADYLRNQLYVKYGVDFNDAKKEIPKELQPILDIAGQEKVCYGDSIYLLYFAEEKELLNRETVYCLRMLISSYMTNLVMNYGMSADGQKKKWKEKLEKYTGNNLIGYWEKEIFTTYLGGRTCEPSDTKQVIVSERTDLPARDWNKTDENRTKLKQMIKEYFFARMILEPVEKNGSTVQYSKRDVGHLRFRLPNTIKWKFNYARFIYSIFDYESVLEEAKGELQDQLKIAYDFDDNELLEADNMFSWKEEFDAWMQKNSRGVKIPAVVPFYSVDFMTTLFIELTEKKNATQVRDRNSFEASYKDFFACISNVLKAYDKYYRIEVQGAEAISCFDNMKEKFEECPFSKSREKSLSSLFETLDTVHRFSEGMGAEYLKAFTDEDDLQESKEGKAKAQEEEKKINEQALEEKSSEAKGE